MFFSHLFKKENKKNTINYVKLSTQFQTTMLDYFVHFLLVNSSFVTIKGWIRILLPPLAIGNIGELFILKSRLIFMHAFVIDTVVLFSNSFKYLFRLLWVLENNPLFLIKWNICLFLTSISIRFLTFFFFFYIYMPTRR